jgi:nitroreductase
VETSRHFVSDEHLPDIIIGTKVGRVRMKEVHLKQIMEKVLRSPSGDNCQPWTFKWNGSALQVFHDAQRAMHPLNPKGITSMIALGCLLESFELAAADFGYEVRWNFFPFKDAGTQLWTEVQFTPKNVPQNPLSEMLLKRFTDRRNFKGGTLSREMFQKEELNDAHLHVLSKPSAELINYIVKAELLLVDHPGILPATMSWARLSSRHVQETQDGVSWQGFGANFWEVPMMPMLRDYPFILRIAKYFIAPQHRARVVRQLRSSAGLVCVSAPFEGFEHSRENFVTAGRLMMNAWLSLTKLGYGVHPLTLPSLIALCANQGAADLPKKWLDLFKEGETLLRREFGISDEEVPIWMIRTGISGPQPEACKTLRFPVSKVLSFES